MGVNIGIGSVIVNVGQTFALRGGGKEFSGDFLQKSHYIESCTIQIFGDTVQQ